MRILFVFVFLSSVAFGQSKKKQIESLNKKVDSLNYVLEEERKLSKQQLDNLKQEFEIKWNDQRIIADKEQESLKEKLQTKELDIVELKNQYDYLLNTIQGRGISTIQGRSSNNVLYEFEEQISTCISLDRHGREQGVLINGKEEGVWWNLGQGCTNEGELWGCTTYRNGLEHGWSIGGMGDNYTVELYFNGKLILREEFDEGNFFEGLMPVDLFESTHIDTGIYYSINNDYLAVDTCLFMKLIDNENAELYNDCVFSNIQRFSDFDKYKFAKKNISKLKYNYQKDTFKILKIEGTNISEKLKQSIIGTYELKMGLWKKTDSNKSFFLGFEGNP